MERLTIDLPQEPPGEFRIFAAGANDTIKGVFHFTAASAQSVMQAAAEWGNDYSVDYEHAAVNFLPVPAPAAGWYVLEVRNGELWAANVRWTARAAEMLRQREYRYLSPAFETGDGHEVMRLINVALTNLPATRRLAPLVAKRSKGAEMNAILTALGLAAEASEVDAGVMALALRNFEREVLAMTGATTREQAHGVLTAWRQSHEQLPQVQAQLETLRAEAVTRERTQLIEAALRDGRLTPALKAWAEAAPLETLRSFLAATPRLVPTGAAQEPSRVTPKTWSELTPIEKHHLYMTNRAMYDALRADAFGQRSE